AERAAFVLLAAELGAIAREVLAAPPLDREAEIARRIADEQRRLAGIPDEELPGAHEELERLPGDEPRAPGLVTLRPPARAPGDRRTGPGRALAAAGRLPAAVRRGARRRARARRAPLGDAARRGARLPDRRFVRRRARLPARRQRDEPAAGAHRADQPLPDG